MLVLSHFFAFGGTVVEDRIENREEFIFHIGSPVFSVEKRVSRVIMKRII